jgi:hypothetical protein
MLPEWGTEIFEILGVSVALIELASRFKKKQQKFYQRKKKTDTQIERLTCSHSLCYSH